uniref:Uncharacterized protein n=1 Tax=Haptolina brevifila TaxID=156173 RepID=A0A7S2FQT3_9EUKA|mmetsp:Transcript_17064/g.34529  ORF Transcript_17064/g.34529 Transcript_17064/m.34529 type:complete len:1028 (+) Transcript_17064:1132-4215(+)
MQLKRSVETSALPAQSRTASKREFQAGSLVWLAVCIYPIVVVYYAAPQLTKGSFNDDVGSAPVGVVAMTALVGGYAGSVLLVGLLSSCVALSMHENRLVRILFPRSTVRLTGANLFAIGSALLDTAQVTALPFLALHEAARWDLALQAVLPGFFQVCADVASAATLFLDGFSAASFQPLFWISFGLVLFWYVLFSLPVVIGDMLKWERSHRVEDSKLWQILVRHLRVTFHFSLVMQLLKPLGCTYTPDLLWADNTTAPLPPYPSSPPLPPPPSTPPPPLLPPACFNSTLFNGTAPLVPGVVIADDDTAGLLAGWIVCLLLMLLFLCFAVACGQGPDDDCDPPGYTAIFVNLACASLACAGMVVMLLFWLDVIGDSSDDHDTLIPLVDCINFTFPPPPPLAPTPTPLAPPTAAAHYAHLRANPSIACWQEDSVQPMMALCGLLAFSFFMVTAHVISDDSPLLGLEQSTSLDVRYSQLYALGLNVGKIGLAICFNLLLGIPWLLTPVLLAGSLLMLLWTLLYHPLLGTSPCCAPLVIGIHVAGQAIAVWACFCCLLTLHHSLTGPSSFIPGLRPNEALCVLGWAVIALLALLALISRWYLGESTLWRLQRTLKENSVALLALERRYSEARCLHEAWAKRRRSWRRSVQKPLDLLSLVQCLVQLEQHLHSSAQPPQWVESARANWQLALCKCSDVNQLLELIRILEQSHSQQLKQQLGRPARSEVGVPVADGSTSISAGEAWLPGTVLPAHTDSFGDIFNLSLGDIFDPNQDIPYTSLLMAFEQLPSIAATRSATGGQSGGRAAASAASAACTSASSAQQPSTSPRLDSISESGPAHLHHPERVTCASLGGGSAGDIETATAHPSPTDGAPAWKHELDAIVVVEAEHLGDVENDGSLSTLPVVQAQLVEVCRVIGAEAPPPAQYIYTDLQRLLVALELALTDSERWEYLINEKASSPSNSCLRPGMLTCAAALMIVKTFTFVFRRKAALVEMYPLLSPGEKAGFASIVEEVLPFSFDRNDCLRDVALQTS